MKEGRKEKAAAERKIVSLSLLSFLVVRVLRLLLKERTLFLLLKERNSYFSPAALRYAGSKIGKKERERNKG